VIDHGRVIAEGHSSELKARVGGDTMRVRVHDPGQRPRAERILGDALGAPVRREVDPTALSARIPADGNRAGVDAVRALAELASGPVAVSDFSFGQPSLDEAFLALTGRPTAGAEQETG
jgi:ABC-2 type transport system ATP-binding protein